MIKKKLHRDLKPANVLVSDTYELKICDMGLAKDLNHKSRTYRGAGTPFTMAPEVWDPSCGFNYPADVFSLGIVFWCILASDSTLSFLDELIGHLVKSDMPVLVAALKKSLHAKDMLPYEKLIIGMLNPNPSSRTSLVDVLVWLKKYVTSL